MKEKKSIQKSIRVTQKVNDYINSSPGSGFNEKLENLVLFFMEKENQIKKDINEAQRQLMSLDQQIQKKYEILYSLEQIEKKVTALLNEIGDYNDNTERN